MLVETRALNQVLRDNRGGEPYPALRATLPIFFENGEGEPAAAAAPFPLRGPSAGVLREANPLGYSEPRS
jgi:hypothetical protein